MGTSSVCDIAELYRRRPTMEYSQALDLAAQGLNLGAGRALAVLSSCVHAVEILKRCPGALDLATGGDFEAATFVQAAGSWSWGTLAAVSLEAASRTYQAILWAEPEASRASSIAWKLRQVADADTILHVISTGPLRLYLPAWQTQPHPACQPAAPRAAVRALHEAGWCMEAPVALHGPRAVFWTKLAQLFEAVGRPDLGDRCLFAMRAKYQEPGWLWPLTPLVLIRARLARA